MAAELYRMSPERSDSVVRTCSARPAKPVRTGIAGTKAE